jgi:hypothetical protein
MAAAVPVNVGASFRNEGFSVIREDDDEWKGHRGRLLCDVTPHSARCLIECDVAFAVPDVGEAEGDAEDDNIRIFMEECGCGLLFG